MTSLPLREHPSSARVERPAGDDPRRHRPGWQGECNVYGIRYPCGHNDNDSNDLRKHLTPGA